jgi:hypothetical protein
MSCPHSAIATSDDHIWIARSSLRTDALASGTGCCSGIRQWGRIKSKGNNMLKKLLSAAAVAATTYAFVPAQAAHVGLGCSDANLAKTEGTAEMMPDVPGKFIAQREMAAAQAALLANKWRECSMHLANAAQAETMVPSYTNTMAQVPYQPTPQAPPPQAGPGPYQGGPGPYQSQYGWGPGQGGWGPGPGPAPQ